MSIDCHACGDTITPQDQHATYIRQLEEHSDDGTLISVGYSEGYATYHLACSPDRWWETYP